MNPALPSGATELSSTVRDGSWHATAQLVGGWVPFVTRVADGSAIDDPTRTRLDLILSTLMVGFGQSNGFTADVQVPFGSILSTSVGSATSGVFALGDLEARARYARRLGPVRASLAAGAAFPTGPAIARAGEAAVLDAARYLTLGRGTTWGLIDLNASLSLPAKVSLFLTSTLRAPFGSTRDGFHWGTELRGTVGVAWGPLFDRRFTFAMGLETQWRAQSLEPDPFAGTLVASANTGGVWLTMAPSVQFRLVDGLQLILSARLPLTQWTSGLQFVPSSGLFFGIGGTFEVIAPPGPQRAAAQRGHVTVVEYGASWCEPCKRLAPQLSAFSVKRPEVVVRTVDASEWSAEELGAVLDGVSGLPVIEIFRADGTLARRLVGEEVFAFEGVVEEVMR